MATQPQIQTEFTAAEHPRWKAVDRIAFRFCFAYFILYIVTTQMITGLFPIPNLDFPDPGALPPIRQTVFWTAAHVFRLRTPLVYTGSGSGDKTFDWVLAFCTLVIAVLAAAVWSLVDGKRKNYLALHKWFYVFLRFSLGSTMLLYGMDKVVPLQMPFPFLTKLVEPYGNFSPMGVLWYSIGASPAYEMFVGAAEMLGGILLFVPRTSLFGALICLADITEVFVLNMTYDVPVKLFSFHLLLMSLVLLAPELRRIATFFFSDRIVGPSQRPQLFRTPRANRIALAVQLVFGVLLIAGYVQGSWSNWHRYGGGAPKSPLYGIWDIDPSSRGADGWRRIIFDRPQGATLQLADDTFVYYIANLDARTGTIALTQASDKKGRGNLKFQRTGQDRLTLDGDLGHAVHLQLKLLDRNKFLLVSRGFHWIQEYPFNR